MNASSVWKRNINRLSVKYLNTKYIVCSLLFVFLSWNVPAIFCVITHWCQDDTKRHTKNKPLFPVDRCRMVNTEHHYSKMTLQFLIWLLPLHGCWCLSNWLLWCWLQSTWMIPSLPYAGPTWNLSLSLFAICWWIMIKRIWNNKYLLNW